MSQGLFRRLALALSFLAVNRSDLMSIRKLFAGMILFVEYRFTYSAAHSETAAAEIENFLSA
jgi:hypothetical protein